MEKNANNNDNHSSQLLTAFCMGDQNAYAEIYNHYRGAVYDFLYSLTRSQEIAEDITHNVFIALWEKREKIDPLKGIRRYLYILARNMAMLHFRKKKNERIHFTHTWLDAIQDIAPDELLMAKEADLLVDVAIARMPKIRKQIFIMFYKEGLNYAQIAHTLNMNKATVANHLSNAKTK
jgi:RNA polymerase sigma-70 factor (ECF subfamily)